MHERISEFQRDLTVLSAQVGCMSDEARRTLAARRGLQAPRDALDRPRCAVADRPIRAYAGSNAA